MIMTSAFWTFSLPINITSIFEVEKGWRLNQSPMACDLIQKYQCNKGLHKNLKGLGSAYMRVGECADLGKDAKRH